MAFLTMPVFGLYFSLRCRNFLSAFVFAVAIGLLLPLVLAEVIRWLWWRTIYGPLYYMNFEWAMAPNVLSAACQGILAVFFWDRMCSRLRRRAFPLQRADG